MEQCSTTPHDLGRQVKILREARRLTMCELARQAGTHESVISRIEAGETTQPSAKTLTSIANILGTTVERLVGRRMQTGQIGFAEGDEKVYDALSPELKSLIITISGLPADDQRIIGEVTFKMLANK